MSTFADTCLPGQCEDAGNPRLNDQISTLFIDNDDYDPFHTTYLLSENESPPVAALPSQAMPPDADSHGKGSSEEPSRRGIKMEIRKRGPRKDRHSKIVTATGPRDRRIRLSLNVAKKFFDLQDELNFDKPSKTMEWLLNMAKDAIKSLSGRSRSGHHGNDPTTAACSTYGCKEEDCITKGNKNPMITECTLEGFPPAAHEGAHPSEAKQSRRKASRHPMFASESRKKARARAREWTTEKKLMQQLGPPLPPPNLTNKPSYDKHEMNCTQWRSAEDPSHFVQSQAMSMSIAGEYGNIFFFGCENSATSVFDGLQDLCSINTPSGSSARSWATSSDHCSF